MKFSILANSLSCSLMNSLNTNAGLSVSESGRDALDTLQLKSTIQQLEKRCKELELNLGAVQERFNYMQKATRDAIWDWDLVNNIGWYSEGLKTLYGYDPSHISNGVKFWYDNIHPEDESRVIEGIHKAIDVGGKNWSDQYRFKKADGTYCWILDRGYAIHDSDGKVVRLVGSMQDITEQKRISKSLAEGEERLRLAIDSAKLGTFDFSPRTGSLVWDDRCRELFGLAAEDHIDYGIFLNAVHPDDREITDQANQLAMSGKGSGEYDIEYRTIGIRDKKLRWVRAKGRGYNDDKGCYRYAGTVIDITDQKEREQKLMEQEERFRTLATMIPQIVWTTDENGIVDFITDKWEYYTGQRPMYERFSFHEMMHEADRSRIVPAWTKAFETGETFRMDYRLKNIRTGEYRWYSSTTAPVKDENGKVTRWVGSATDIHDQKVLEQRLEDRVNQRTKELIATNTRLERSNAELEQYAYVTSHDLKEPLRKVQFFSDLITRRFGESIPAEATQYLTRISSSAGRMTSLINDLLAYSRLSDTDNRFEKVDLQKLVTDVQNDFDLVSSERNISIVADSLPTVAAIRLHMQQLFGNLISNAIKFSKPGVANNIYIKGVDFSEKEKSEWPELNVDLEYCKIVITDEGIGFDNEYSEKIFSIFHRLNDRKEVEGHGIGLALCRKIANAHQGIIFASGVEGAGATFTIILPMAGDNQII